MDKYLFPAVIPFFIMSPFFFSFFFGAGGVTQKTRKRKYFSVDCVIR